LNRGLADRRPVKNLVLMTLLLFALLRTGTSVHAQPILLEFRLVPQSGLLPGIISDDQITLVSISLDHITPEQRTRRFELQFRLIDLNPADEIVPSGLSAVVIDITAAVTGGPAADLTVTKARISNYESRYSSSVPPTSTDSSGFPTGGFTGARGLHAPYRGGISGPPPNNDSVPNGTINGLDILQITPICLGGSGQGDPGIDPANQNAWYGLYSFELTAGNDFAGFVTYEASSRIDPGTGSRFGFFNSGFAVPLTSSAAVDASITTVVINIPAPASAVFMGMLAAYIRGRVRAEVSIPGNAGIDIQ